MRFSTFTRHRAGRRTLSVALGLIAIVAVTACGGSSTTGTQQKVGVALILKTFTNPFFVSMENDAKAEAAKVGVNLNVTAGTKDGDVATQITSIENAVSAGYKGILITPNGPGVNAAIGKARTAGLYVISLDTPPNPPSTVDITFATDNLEAGKLIGKWTAAQLNHKAAVIAMLDLFNDQIVSVDLNRDHGFLQGMAMETCLSKNPAINVVYTINEPAAAGAYTALKAAGHTDGVLIVSVDGGCAGVGNVQKGVIGAPSQQYPGRMAKLGVDAIYGLATKGTKPAVSPGLDFYNTGVSLVTDKPVTGLDSVTSTQGASTCWGTA